MRFTRPPLVELIAELQWGQPALMLPSTRAEEIFMNFGAKVAARGYTRLERVVPAGFPLPSHQVVYRYRKDASTNDPSLYQLGTGVFSANITPPYTSWTDFRAIVLDGITTFLSCRTADENQQPFVRAVLQYINSFTDHFTGKHTPISFIQDVLGFTIKLPSAISARADATRPVTPSLQFVVPLTKTTTMQLQIAPGLLQSGQQTLMMNISIVSEVALEALPDVLMTAFDAAHDVIHQTFVEMTTPIADVMQPQGDSSL